ncbi:MAG: hypothetical protein IJC63_06905, partial [Myxococcaceae bacterium]|nr:hypothetical protein [Myxococcaceae bacterium]
LAKLYYAQGEELMKKEHYADAFKVYYKGYQLDSKNRNLLERVAWLEQMASKFLRNDPGCESAQLAADITIPKSGVNKRAQEMLLDYNCL